MLHCSISFSYSGYFFNDMDDIPDEINTSMEESDKDADKEVGSVMFEFLSQS